MMMGGWGFHVVLGVARDVAVCLGVVWYGHDPMG